MTVVVIPVYKIVPNQFELISFERCVQTLKRHTICIITHEKLDISYYLNILKLEKKTCRIEYFNKNYFNSIEGYNQLMLSIEFYNRFRSFEYMLIYQLDAYVFNDELDYWCDLGYDYIGAPWIENNITSEVGGNGGFSLRKISSFIKVLETRKKIVYNPLQLIKQYKKNNSIIFFISKVPLIILRIFGYRNSSQYFLTANQKKTEDFFWAYNAKPIYSQFKVVQGNLAVKFSFEGSPLFLYEKNNFSLPFGCHAWEKNDYPDWLNIVVKNYHDSK